MQIGDEEDEDNYASKDSQIIDEDPIRSSVVTDKGAGGFEIHVSQKD